LWKWEADPAGRHLIKVVKGCTRSIDGRSSCEIEWSSDSKFFATRWDKNVLAYNTQGEIVHSYKQDDDIYAIQWSADNKFIAVGSNNYSAIYDASSDQRIRCVEGACRHRHRHIKIIPGWAEHRFIARYNYNARVWNF
jgi:WD40 repeat protein